MHLFESWACKPELEIELCSHSDFDAKGENKNDYSIYYVSESEVNSDQEPFAQIINLYGETKHSILYPENLATKKFFIIAPTLSEPKKLDLDMCGAKHVANAFGAKLTQAILSLPIPEINDAKFYITLSEKMKEIAQTGDDDFLVGITQRSVSTKMKKIQLNQNPNKGIRTVIFREDLFSNTALNKAQILSNCMSVTRSLISMPANVLNPKTYTDCLKFLVKKHNAGSEESQSAQITLDVLDEDQLHTMGCELICAVGQGSAVPPRIVKLTMHPQESEKTLKHIALVGKGITYDTGGYSIKPSPYMRNMKKDMGGSAAAVGIFFACAKLNLPIHLTCYLAIAENMISDNAMRPGDIYKAYNGITVEIDNTDAEGRLVLADTLSLACESKPDWVIDFATLTGAARVALGPLVDPLFGNRAEYNQLLQNVGLETGDWVWNLPLPAQYNSYFDSKTADIVNSTASPFAGAITAALFLQKFVGTTPWTHIDTFMWIDRPTGMWGEDNAPTAKCVRLIVNALEAKIKE